MRIRELHRETWVNSQPEDAFSFFANTKNLLKITPDTIPLTILKEPPQMKEGARIDLKMKLFGFIPIRWQTLIENWESPYRFVDTQPSGPYRYWRHEHTFLEKDGGTLVIDHVEYAVPGFFLEPLIHFLFVQGNLQYLFDYRQKMYPKFLGG